MITTGLSSGSLKGRPKGSKKETKKSDEIEITLNWVGKHKKFKNPWETDAEFRKDFLENGLPVRECTNLSGGSLQRYYDHDLEYAR